MKMVRQDSVEALFNSIEEERMYYVHQFITNYKLKNPLIPKLKVNIREYLNNERKRFYNTARGLIHCKEMGIPFAELNKFCFMCNYKKECNGV